MGTRKISFTANAWDELPEWEEKDRQAFKNIKSLIKEVYRNPFSGEGKPEKLKGFDKRNLYSRRINEKDRLVYEVLDEVFLIHQVKGHYNDK